jgi:hypothetical protein
LEVEGGGPFDPVIIFFRYRGLTAPRKIMTSRRPSRQGGITLPEVLVGVMAVVLLAAILLPMLARSRRYDHLVRCAGNLKALHAAQSDPKAAWTGPQPLGSAYWTRLADAGVVGRDTLLCPLAEPAAGRTCDYRGPAREVGPLNDNASIGCDDEENHGPHGRVGGNVLLKSGAVRTDDGQVWRDALQLHCVR